MELWNKGKIRKAAVGGLKTDLTRIVKGFKKLKSTCNECDPGRSGEVRKEKVPGTGFEPASLAAYAPQTYVSTNFTTRAE